MENQAFENNNIDHESFISEIQAKSVLWDPTSKNKILKEKASVDISKKLNTSVKKCQNFWKNLRHQNVKKNKTIEQMPSSSAATKDEDFQSMTFLNTVKVEKRSISNFDTASRCTVPEVETSDDGKSEFDQTSMAEGVIPGPTYEKEPPKFSSSNRKRKYFEHDQLFFYKSVTNLALNLTKRDDDEIESAFELMMIKTRRLENKYPSRVLPMLKDLMDKIESQFY